jgi:quercetin dioxygenase-like cupin family protein
MKISPYTEIDCQPVDEPGASGVTIRWLITAQDGRTDFCMRHFDVAPGGFTPEHEHDWEHQVFILEGEGTVLGGAETQPFKAGDVIFVAPGERHQFRNTGDGTARFLCLIPSPEKCSL